VSETVRFRTRVVNPGLVNVATTTVISGGASPRESEIFPSRDDEAPLPVSVPWSEQPEIQMKRTNAAKRTNGDFMMTS
jgi:hypothetical protein